MTLRHRLGGLVLLAVLAAASVPASAQILFRADLTGTQEVPPVATTASGLVTATLDGSTLIVRGSFEGLESNYNTTVGSHIHNAPEGSNGPVVFALDPALTSDLRSGEWFGPENRFPLDADQIQTLADGNFYVNVHSLDNPAGEVRGQLVAALSLNEIRADQPGDDDDEYVEIAGPAGASLDGYSFVVIGDSGSGGNGVIEEVIDLTGNVIPADGYFLFGQLSLATPDLDVDINLENGDAVTYVLVEGVAGTEGDDLDIEDDGVIDSEPWSNVADAVGLDNGDDEDATYAEQLGFEDVGPDGTFRPAHVFRNRDNGVWRIGASDPDGGFDTPGEINASTSLVQIIHNAPEAGVATVDVYVDDVIAVDDLDFRSATPFVLLPAVVSLNLDVAPGTSSSADEGIYDVDVVLDGARTYYVVAAGLTEDNGDDSDDFRLALYDNARRFSTTPETVDVGFFHGTPDAPTIDVRTGGIAQAVLFDDTETFTFSENTYQPAGPGEIELEVTSADNQDVFARFMPDFAGLEEQSVLMLASGYATPATNEPALSLLLVQTDGSTVLAPALGVSVEGEASGDALRVRSANPVRGTVDVRFATPTAGEATLTVVDLLGRRVATLARGPVASGEHVAEWNASGVAPGVYVLRLQAGGEQVTRSVTVVR